MCWATMDFDRSALRSFNVADELAAYRGDLVEVGAAEIEYSGADALGERLEILDLVVILHGEGPLHVELVGGDDLNGGHRSEDVGDIGAAA